MIRKEPSSQTTLVVQLGASEWPRFPELPSSDAFTNSARQLKAYLLNPRQFGIPTENLLDLFDADESADDIDSKVCDFLDQRIAEMTASGNAARDLLVYYVGHGGFVGPQNDYFLAIRRTRSNNPGASSIRIASLADTLKEKARRLRRILILDCCFAAAAFQSFQSGPGQVAIQQAVDAFKEKSEGSGYPEKGTALLCSSGPKVPSLISQDGHHTMFTEALLEALTTGNPRQQNKSYLSLRELSTLTADLLADSRERNAPRPHLHSPDQSEGDVADIPFFPNLAARVNDYGNFEVKDYIVPPTEAFGKLSPSMDAPRRRWGPAVLGGKAEHKRENDLDEVFALSYTLSSEAPSSLAVSSDGLLLVSGGISQGTTQVWNLRTKQLVYKIHTGNYGQAVAISPDTHLLASSNAPGLPITSTKEKIKVWDTRTGNLLYTFAEHEYAVTSLAFTPDSQALVSGSFDAVKMWDLQTGLLLHTFECSCLTSLAINSDGLILSSDCLDDQKIEVRNAQTGQVLYMLPGLSGSVRYTAISPDGRTFVGSSNSEAIKVWDMQTSELLDILERGPDTLISLAISSDRQTLIKGFESKIEVWEKRDRRFKKPGDDVDIKAVTDRLARSFGITKLESKRE